MEKYDLQKEKVKIHNIVITITTKPDYEMNRWLLLEDLEDLKWNEYVIVEGFHCSCYNFDDTTWEAIKYTEEEELVKIAKDRINKYSFDSCDRAEKEFYRLVLEYMRKGE